MNNYLEKFGFKLLKPLESTPRYKPKRFNPGMTQWVIEFYRGDYSFKFSKKVSSVTDLWKLLRDTLVPSMFYGPIRFAAIYRIDENFKEIDSTTLEGKPNEIKNR